MSNSRNLAKLIVDSNGDVSAASLDNVPPSNDASALTTGTLSAARIADASLTAAKLAVGAAASNLGNYVTTVNGSTGAVSVATAAQGALADSAVQPASLAAVATSGSYADLTGKPTLATVASTGSYTDLANKPTIPTTTSQLTNNSGFITSATPPTTYNTVGTYGLLHHPNTTVIPNGTYSGGSLRYTTQLGDYSQNPSFQLSDGRFSGLSGTWRCMGCFNNGSNVIDLFVRIS